MVYPNWIYQEGDSSSVASVPGFGPPIVRPSRIKQECAVWSAWSSSPEAGEGSEFSLGLIGRIGTCCQVYGSGLYRGASAIG